MASNITPEPLTPERRTEIRARADAATSGPWHASDRSIYSEGIGAPIIRSIEDWGHSKSREDTQFIAHARTDVPDLLGEIERLEVERDEWKRKYEFDESDEARQYDDLCKAICDLSGPRGTDEHDVYDTLARIKTRVEGAERELSEARQACADYFSAETNEDCERAYGSLRRIAEAKP